MSQCFTLEDAAEQRGCLAAACCWRRPEQSQTSDSSEAGWGRRLNFKKDLTLINFCLFGFVVSLFSFKSEKLHQCKSCSSKDICLSLDIFAVSETLIYVKFGVGLASPGKSVNFSKSLCSLITCNWKEKV